MHSSCGFSLIEICTGLLLAAILIGFALINANTVSRGLKANRAMYQTVAQLRNGRQSAIAQRRNVQLQLLGNNQIMLIRRDVPGGTTMLSMVSLEDHYQFIQFDSISDDTPDHFGNSAAVDFGGADPLTFLSDGTLANSSGNPINGTIFLGLPGHPEVARAVTILGSTGRVQGYRWNGSAWIQ
jgi:Tfp pilus assembly protein FimT